MGALSKEESFFAPTDLEEGEYPTTGQRLRGAAVLMPLYYFAAYKLFGKPILEKLLALHPNWKAVGERAGTFNKNAQQEVIYVTLTGIHHGIFALMVKWAWDMQKSEEAGIEKKQNKKGSWSHRSLFTYAGTWELAFEYVDWLCIAFKKWPFEDPDPKFVALVNIHHLCNLLWWPSWNFESSYKKENKKMMFQLMAASALSFLVNTYQQLLNLKSKSGLRQAFIVQLLNIVVFTYTRIYVWFTDAYKLNNSTIKEVDTRRDMDESEKSMLKFRFKTGFAFLSVFNIVATVGSAGNCVKYLQALRELNN